MLLECLLENLGLPIANGVTVQRELQPLPFFTLLQDLESPLWSEGAFLSVWLFWCHWCLDWTKNYCGKRDWNLLPAVWKLEILIFLAATKGALVCFVHELISCFEWYLIIANNWLFTALDWKPRYYSMVLNIWRNSDMIWGHIWRLRWCRFML